LIPKPDTFFSLELPYGEPLSLERTVIRSGRGPRVAIISGIHGDELEGQYVCHQLARWLAEHPKALKGAVELYPAANPLGLMTLQRAVPVYDTDLNRNFPGHAQGLVPQRIADALMQAAKQAALVIDIHASNIFLREIPQVRINRAFEHRLVPLAQSMNLDIIWVHGSLTVLESTLSHSLNALDTPCLVVEMGVGMRITPAFTEQLVTGILHVWQHLGVIDRRANLPALTHDPALANDQNVYFLNAEVSGLFIPDIDRLAKVRRGQLLGRIVSPLRSDTLSEVRSPVDGMLFTLREYPLVYEGSLLARIMEMSLTEAVP
jgi:predicted deacylase